MNEKYIEVENINKHISELANELKSADKEIAKIVFKTFLNEIDNLNTISWNQELEYQGNNVNLVISKFAINNIEVFFAEPENEFWEEKLFLKNLGKDFFLNHPEINHLLVSNGEKKFNRVNFKDYGTLAFKRISDKLQKGEKYFYNEKHFPFKKLHVFNSFEEYQNHMSVKYKDLKDHIMNPVIKKLKNIYDEYGELFFINSFGDSSTVHITKAKYNIEVIEDYVDSKNEGVFDYYISKLKNSI